MNTPTDSNALQNEPPPQVREIQGKWIVIAMFSFAVLATGTLWTYWKLHMMPFMPLQEVLIEQFPNSSPRVEGGQSKMHKDTPMLLRVVMRVEFDPELEKEAAETFVDRVSDAIKPHVEPNKWEELHVHLYQQEPEKELRQKTFERNWRADADQDSPGQTESDKSASKSRAS